MDFTSSLVPGLGFAQLIVKAILVLLLGICLLIAFIAIRRWYRGRYFQKLSERTFALRAQWNDILTGAVPASAWRLNQLDCHIVESILLDSIEVATPAELQLILDCLRSSGLLDMRIYQARSTTGWKRRNALVALGRTRTPEVIPALAEALDSLDEETRIAAVRGLSNTELPQAAIPILDRLHQGTPTIPEHSLKNALANCCRKSPDVLLRYMKQSTGWPRQMLARVLAEMATPELGEDLILLATDDDPEVRASAARALGNSQPSFAMPVLSVMVKDQTWFVRLRAVVALASINHSARVRPLLHALCDSNRFVRQRAAWALTQMGANLDNILSQVVETHDNYALQAFISELERSGAIENLVAVLEKGDVQGAANISLQWLNESRKNIENAGKVFAASAGRH